MPPIRDMTMLKMNSTIILIAMAKKEWEPKDLAEHAGVTYHIACTARRGCLTKPKYAGKIAKALGLEVEDIVETIPKINCNEQITLEKVT